MRRVGLAIIFFILLAALGFCLVALISEEWRNVTVTGVPVNGLAYLNRVQGLEKECWTSSGAVQFNVTSLSNYVPESLYCLHIGIGTTPYVMDARAGLLSGALLAFVIAGILGLTTAIVTLIAIFSRSKEYGQTFNNYLRGGVGLSLAAALVSVLGMIFFHMSLMIQDDESVTLSSKYPEEYYKDMTALLRRATTYDYGYAFWCGWMCAMAFLICTLICLALICDCCGIEDYREEQLQVTPRSEFTSMKPVTRHVMGPPIYIVKNQHGKEVFYDPWKNTVLDGNLPIGPYPTPSHRQIMHM